MTPQEKIQADLAAAMRSKDALRLSVLRMMKTAVKNREIEKMKPLEEAEVLAVLNTLVKQRKDSIDQFRKGNREDLAQKEESEIVIIEAYLPAAASDEDISNAITEAMTETGATTMKEMGKVIGALKKHPDAGLIDFGAASKLVQAKLP